MKKIDTGGLSFPRLRDGDYWYVDKTLLIKDILDTNEEGVYQFTRPRRFGKTTNLSMLDAFFNLKYKGNTWFDDLEISKYREYEKFRNAFPVIHVDLRPAKERTYDDFIDGIRLALYYAFEDHDYLLNKDDLKKPVRDLFHSLEDGDTDIRTLKASLRLLSEALEGYHGKKVVLLIDEYDCALSEFKRSDDQRMILDFMRQFLGQALKGNDSLQMAYVTGIMQVAKESIFSDLNNIKINNIFSKASDERFGFTELEVRELLDHYGHPEKIDEVREWYDGYRFGNVDVYNPFSIMNYAQDGFVAQPYWVNSGGSWIMMDLLQRIDEDNMATLIGLTTGQSSKAELSGALAFDDICSSDSALFSLMAMSGYLNAVPDGNGEYEISIPNKEVMKMVDGLLKKLNPIKTSDFLNFNRAVLEGDAESISRILERILMDSSYMNLRENAYEMIVMTLLHGLTESYNVRTEYEAGYGRTDIILIPRTDGRPNMILELKVVDSKDHIDSGLDEAMSQIHDRRYYLGMTGKVILFAMCFWNKVPKVRLEIITV